MFRLSIVDHIRLSFGHVVQNYTVHARAADRLAAVAMNSRTAILLLVGTGTVLSVAVLLGAGRYVQIAAAIVNAIAFGTYAIVASLGVEDRTLAHRVCANRLWLLCERYRALLAEIHDGLIERDVVLARRDELIRQFHDIYEQAAPTYSRTGRTAPRAPRPGAALSDDQIDEFLPESLRQAAAPDAAAAPGTH